MDDGFVLNIRHSVEYYTKHKTVFGNISRNLLWKKTELFQIKKIPTVEYMKGTGKKSEKSLFFLFREKRVFNFKT